MCIPSETGEKTQSSSTRRGLWLLGLVAAAVRCAYVLAVRRHTLGWGDEFTYDQLAQNLLHGHGFCFVPGRPTVTRAPLYAGFLAGMYALFGHQFLPVFLLQAVAGGLCAPLLARIGGRVSGSAPAGLLAGWLFALDPLFVFAANLLYTETLHVLLLLLIVSLWQTTFARRTVGDASSWLGPAVASGLLLGLNNLLKPNMMLFPLCLLPVALLMPRGGRRAVLPVLLVIVTMLLPVLLVIVTMLLPVLPWAVRNHQVSGHWVLVSANSGVNLFQGNNSQVTSGTGLALADLRPTPGLSEVQQDDIYRQQGKQWILAHPLAFAGLALPKLAAFFSPVVTTTRGHLLSRLAPLLDAACLGYYGLALFGWVVTRRRWRTWLLMDLLILYPALLAVVFYGGTRYGMPAQPFIMLYCACGLLWLAAKAHLLPMPTPLDNGSSVGV